jgi:predicted nucleotidyltransferase
MINSKIVKDKLLVNHRYLTQKYHLNYIAIFGSISRGENNEKSDVDILVDFTQPIGILFIDLADELENILNNKVDLVSRNGVKSKYFEQIKNDLIYV